MVSGKMGKSEFIQFLRTSSNSIAAQYRWLDPLHLHGLAAYGAKCPPFSARTRVRFAARSLAFKCIPRRNRFRHNPRRRNESQSLGERHIGNASQGQLWQRRNLYLPAPSNTTWRLTQPRSKAGPYLKMEVMARARSSRLPSAFSRRPPTLMRA